MVGFYKHDIPAWMDGTEGLSDAAYRAYHVVIQLIMLNEGPISLNERGIAGRCNTTVRALQRSLRELEGAGKLSITDGRIHNGRAARELATIMENRENAGKGGKARAFRQKAQGNSPDCAAKSLLNNDGSQATLECDASLKEKRREDPPLVPQGGRKDPDLFLEFKAAYPKRNTAFPTTAARERWLKAIRQGANPVAIIAGAKSYAAEQAKIGKVGTEFVKTADAWLHQGRWKDHDPTAEPSTPPAATVSADTWRDRVQTWRDRGGHWPWKGPAPDLPGTLVPPAVLADFGIPTDRAA